MYSIDLMTRPTICINQSSKVNASGKNSSRQGKFNTTIQEGIIYFNKKLNNISISGCKGFIQKNIFQKETNILKNKKENLNSIIENFEHTIFCSLPPTKKINELKNINTRVRENNLMMCINPFNPRAERKDLAIISVTLVVCSLRPLISTGILREDNPAHTSIPLIASLIVFFLFLHDYTRAQLHKVKYKDLATVSEIHNGLLDYIDFSIDTLDKEAQNSMPQTAEYNEVRRQETFLRSSIRSRHSIETHDPRASLGVDLSSMDPNTHTVMITCV